MATIRLDGDGAESAAPNAARSGERPPAASAPGDSLVAAVERKIPFQFREGLLDAGHFEEDQHFERFIGDLQTRFARSVDASNLLADFQSRWFTHISTPVAYFLFTANMSYRYSFNSW